MKNALVALLVGLVSIFAVGCGDSDSNTSFVATGNNTAAANTGNLTFNFVTPQAATVPTGTATLVFNFYDAANNLIFQDNRPFATTITVVGVPTAAVRVEIVALDANNNPLTTISQDVTVSPGSNTIVDLGDANVVSVSFDRIEVTPASVKLVNGGTQALLIRAFFGNGQTITIDGDAATYSGNDTNVATVADGVITGVNPGTTTVTVSYTVGGTEKTATVNIESCTFVLDPNSASIAPGNTFGTFDALFNDGTAQNVTGNTNFVISPAVTGITATPNATVTVENGVNVGTTATLVGTWTRPGDGRQFSATANITVGASEEM